MRLTLRLVGILVVLVVSCALAFENAQEQVSLTRRTTTAVQRPNVASSSSSSSSQQERRRDNALIKFAIPIFAFTWSSPNVLHGDVRQDLHLLGSTVAGPLRDVVEDFVFGSYTIQLARLQNDATLPEMIRKLKSVEFTVQVVYDERNKEEDHSLRRNLQTAAAKFDFYAQFEGWAYFIQPSNAGDIPSDEYMQETLGTWREAFMVEDYMVLIDALQKSDEPLLKHLSNLLVLNDVEPNDFPYEPETPLQAPMAPGDKNDDNNNSIIMNDMALSFFVVVGATTLLATLFLVRPYVFKPRSRQSLDAAQQLGAFPQHIEPPVSLPGRGEGSEGEDMDPALMEESDLWLQQHRPDLFRALKRSESFRNQEAAAASRSSDGIMKDQTPRSNPLQFLYGGLFVRRSNRGDPALPSVSLASRDSHTLEDVDLEDDAEMLEEDATTPSWWQKLAQSLHGHTLACDEDPSQYDFAFSDFPRHDGTPCLIFSETETGPALIRVTRPESVTRNQSLSNEDFKLQLSMHGNTDLNDSGPITEDDLDGGVEFTSKLERLIAMRHRHYEKERIIQKGRQARDQERRNAEARERELKLRRHEMELDLGEIEASLTPRALSRKNFQSQQSFDSDVVDRKKAHRVILSDSNYFAAVDGAGEGRNSGTVELATIGGPSLRHDSEDIPPPPPRIYSHSRNLSDSSPRKVSAVDCPHPHALKMQPMNHRRSHRRSFSHGTQETEEKKTDHVNHKRNGSNADDVMTFGIAAYTNFT